MSTISHPTSFVLLFTQLARRLRQTNARYHHIAYQCRHTRRPTYHAKRHAHRAGLRIDTSKARAAGVNNVFLSQTTDPGSSSPLFSALSVFVSRETEAGNEPEENRAGVEEDGLENGPMSGLELTLRNLPKVIAQVQYVHDPEPYSLPLFQGPVPGAPRWKSIPLPEDVPACEPVWQFRGAMAASASHLDSMVADLVHHNGGASANAHLLKRKMDKITGGMISRQPEPGVVNEGTRNESQKRRRGL
ncbi:hypothetical protein JVU11DRAFT_9523 [Chiua virens]|nr:hypothetical protein JVU11DRAFT_9523 [Chiua virens]